MKSGICTEEGLPGRAVGKLFRQSRELSFYVCSFFGRARPWHLPLPFSPAGQSRDFQEVVGGLLGKRHGKRQRDPEGILDLYNTGRKR